VPPEELPYVVNPKSGYIVSANNFITSENAKNGISHSFAFITRAIRITEMLDDEIQAGHKLTVQDMQKMQ